MNAFFKWDTNSKELYYYNSIYIFLGKKRFYTWRRVHWELIHALYLKYEFCLWICTFLIEYFFSLRNYIVLSPPVPNTQALGLWT